MEAIIELIAASVGALFQALIGIVEGVVALLAIVVEFAFLAVTQGITAASRQYNHRKQERAERLAAGKPASDIPVRDEAPSISRKQSAILAVIVLVVIAGGVATRVVGVRIREQRVAETRAQVKKLADTFAEQIKDDGVADPVPGKLRDRDGWEQPVELFVDKTLLGSLIVVRSSGPDRQTGSIDDILATRVIRASAKDVGGELANRGIKALRDRVAGLLPGGDEEQLPEDMDVGEQ
ncbi:MAG: hypothetical protein SFV81_30010 [Pirellulaceae bacterium]|nr:hypothetical protein [Pirellulaceae bacterium]